MSKLTSSNLIKSSGFAYRTAVFDIPSVNTWVDVPLDAGNKNLINISHNIGVNPERMTFGISGNFEMIFKVNCFLNTVPRQMVMRVFKNNTSEILGSHTQESITNANENASIVGFASDTFAVNDYITLQVGTNGVVTNELQVYDDPGLPNPVTSLTASMFVRMI